MRPLTWLHISDLHLRVGSEWAQDVVLTEMCRHIEQQRNDGSAFDFILVTGDIAFSGRAEEYAIAEQFLGELETKSGVLRERTFCVPGNHDIDRTKQQMAFKGARGELRNQSSVDTFLANQSERDNLLTRQLNYRNFQASYFADQSRQWTTDNLAYESRLQIDDLSLAILGLDSTWLAEGGDGDHGNLLMGEMQVINAIRHAMETGDSPNVVIAMAHHPFHLLQEFDRLRVQTRVERDTHFFHHGHLHQAGTRMTGPLGSKCLTVAAGASYMSRHDFNAYSIVKLDFLEATRSVKTFVYSPTAASFSLSGDEEVYSIEITPTSLCSVGELAETLIRYDLQLEQYAYYLSALMLGQKSDYPVPENDNPVLATIEVVQSWPDGDLKNLATNLTRFRNVLKVLFDGGNLDKIVVSHGPMFAQYAPTLANECATVPGLRERLAELEEDAQRLAGMEPQQTFLHTWDLFEELAESGEWHLLKEQAERHVHSDDQSLATQATRMYALSLAKEGGSGNISAAIEHYRTLATSDCVEFDDLHNFTVLLADSNRFDEAVSVVFKGIELFPDQKSAFLEIGHAIVRDTGDRQLRRRLEQINRGQE